MERRMEKGFTLVELMIVVAIISILSAVAVPQLRKYVDRARVTKVKQTVAYMNQISAIYAVDHFGAYAANVDEVVTYSAWDTDDLPKGTTVTSDGTDITISVSGGAVTGTVANATGYHTANGKIELTALTASSGNDVSAYLSE